MNYQTLQNMKVFLAQETRRRMQYENKTRAENNAIFVARDRLTLSIRHLKSRRQRRYPEARRFNVQPLSTLP